MNYGFLLGNYFADLLKRASNSQIPDNLLNFAAYTMDLFLIIAIVVAIGGVIFQLIKFGLRKVNSDGVNQTKEEKLQQRKDVYRSMLVFGIVIAVCLLIPAIFSIVVSLIGI